MFLTILLPCTPIYQST